MYYSGQGVEQDLKKAVKWFQKASDQGNAWAQYNLGLVYANGKGVNPDYVVAYAWCDIAAANEQESAIEAKPKLTKVMNPDQIAKAEALAQEMIEKNSRLIQKKK